MNGRNTFNLLFYLRNNRPDDSGRVPIYLRITAQGTESTISINRKVLPQVWNKARGCIRLRTKEAEELNPYLETLREKVQEAHRQLISEGKPVTPDAITSIILRRKEKEFTLVKLMERHNSQMESGLGITSSYGNFKNYKTSLRYIKEFIKQDSGQMDLLLSELDASFLERYVLYLQKEKSCHHNGAMKQVQRLNKVLNVAINHNWIGKHPFYNYKIKFKPYDKVILSWDELQQVENLTNLSDKLSLVKDAFIFSCYTGLAYVDVKNLTWDKVVNWIDGSPWIITRRTKTETKSRIPLLPIALEIMEKYRDNPNNKEGYVIPIYSNQKTNDYLKILASLAGITKNISFHSGRHIFATVITLSNGVPIETVSKMLGHKDIRTTQVYSKVLDQKIAKDFEDLKINLKKQK
jgi:site-specific recombinase XerD